MNFKDRAIHKAIRDALVPLAVSAAELKQRLPSRTGGYLLSLDAIMQKLGLERATLNVIDVATKSLQHYLQDSADSIEYIANNREFVIHFNDKLALSEKFVHFGTTAHSRFV